MSDVAELSTPDAAAPTANIVQIPITKLKGETVEVNFDTLPIEVYQEMLVRGAKDYINTAGMSKMTGLTKLTGEEAEKLKEQIRAIAQKNAEDMANGTIKFAGAKAEVKVSGAVNTEAMRIAKALVKDSLKKAGKKISHIPPPEITAAAKEVLRVMPEIYKTAEKNLQDRADTAIKGIDVTSLVKADPKLVAKAEEKKAAKKKGATPAAEGQLSAKQAAIPAKKKPQAAQHTAH